MISIIGYRRSRFNAELPNQTAEDEIRAILDHPATRDPALAQMHQVLLDNQAQARHTQ